LAEEQRQLPRKIIRSKAMWVLAGTAPVAARTIDIGVNGMALLLDDAATPGQQGQVSFKMFLDGKENVLTSRATVMYCLFSSSGFKVGLQFSNLELSAKTAIAKFMH
jgi:c-di-GMP-binding flagellar brake protein YcgR